jgi:hypothetical protein
MAVNTLRSPQKEEKKSIFSHMGKMLKVDKLFEEGLPVKYLPYVLYITAILIFYIGNAHNSDRNIKKIDKLKIEVNDLRADYTTLKAELMYKSKQSEVAKEVTVIELEESVRPPYKIILKKGEY